MGRLPFVVAVTLVVANCHLSAPPLPSEASHSYDLADIDRSQNACTDFYRYARGGWAARTPIPAAYPEYGTVTILIEKNRDTIRRIIEDAAAAKRPGENQRKIGAFYASCMDEDAIKRQGMDPIRGELESIESINGPTSLAKEIARLQFDGVDAPFAVGSTPDPGKSTEVILQIEQGGLGLPQPDYYFSRSETSNAIRDSYSRHVAKIFQLAGDDPDAAGRRAETVLAFETRLAASSMSRAMSRDPNAVSHPMTVEQLHGLAPKFDWDSYFAAIGIRQPEAINIAQPAFIVAMERELDSTPIGDWKTYLRWQLLHRASPSLSAPFVDEDFDFYSRKLKGVGEETARWKRCVGETGSVLSDAVGQLYVQSNYSPEARRRSMQMVRGLVEAFRTELQNVDWMDSSTKLAALQKLDAMRLKVGYPETWRDYSALAVERESYILNEFRADNFELHRTLMKVGKAPDASEWRMSPQTPNASYNATMNEITIPAAVFQPPLYDVLADEALNYGGIGVLIAHEITHGFDDRGAKYDSDGNLRNWWSKKAAENFDTRVACIADQFDDYVVDGVHQQGKLVVGEAIADLGGATVAYAAFEKATQKRQDTVRNGLTPEQRFFLGYARMWSVNIRPEYARARAISDYHPIGSSRVNAPLSNMPAFGSAFGCKAGDPMMRPPAKTCAIW